MAKTIKRKYAPSAGKDVKIEMHRYKRGTAKSGPGGKGGKVKSRKQAVAIALSKARKEGKKVPRKKGPEAASSSVAKRSSAAHPGESPSHGSPLRSMGRPTRPPNWSLARISGDPRPLPRHRSALRVTQGERSVVPTPAEPLSA
jgi:hypothetical protein